MLVTRGLTIRPRMSNLMMSPTWIRARSAIWRSTETSGSADGPFQNVPSMTRSFASRWSR
jgi:hypothetical protein